MVRKITFLLILVFVLLAACGGTETAAPTATLVEVTPLPPATEPPPTEPPTTEPPTTEPPTAEPTATELPTIEPTPTAEPPTATAEPPMTTAEPSATAAMSATLSEQMDAYIQSQADTGRFSGAVYVVHNGDVLISKAYGLADRVNDTPNTPTTRFAIGTLSMPVTAVAVLQLAEQGQLALEDPICNYLENCPDGWARVEIQHLLAQSSGIPVSHAKIFYDIAKDMGDIPPNRVQQLSNSTLEFTSGSQWPGLQNSDYRLLGLIIENASGQSYSDFLETHIFSPLGMENTALTNDATGMALGYSDASDQSVELDDLVEKYAGSGLSSTIEDMARFLNGLQSGALLSPEASALMVDRATLMSPGWHTGLGWFMSDFDDRFFSASMPNRLVDGYNGDMVILPEENLSWVVLSNESGKELGYIGDRLTLMALDAGK